MYSLGAVKVSGYSCQQTIESKICTILVYGPMMVQLQVGLDVPTRMAGRAHARLAPAAGLVRAC
jgi:hypothetical protein